MTISEAVDILAAGSIVAFPTETVYGLAADALNPAAVKKIFEAKGRPADNPLIVHIADADDASSLATGITEPVMKLMQQLWPGPLTLILPKRSHVPDIVTAGLPTVALRVPDHPTALELIKKSGPLAAPSANISGRPSSTSREHVLTDFGGTVPVVDGPPSTIGLESTVVDVSEQPYTILRPGAVTAQQIRKVSGVKTVYLNREKREMAAGKQQKVAGPGLKYTHYKPLAEVAWFNHAHQYDRRHVLLVTHSLSPEGFPQARFYNKNFDLLAKELYDLFRMADHHHLKSVLIERLPDNSLHPLLPALENRIVKAMSS